MSVKTQDNHIFFQGDSIATTGWVYNSSDGNNATTGWETVDTNEVLVQIGCGTLSLSGDLHYRIEGKFDGLNRSASINTGKFSQAETEVDRLVRVTDRVKELRIGAKLSAMVASVLGSPNNFYAAVCMTDYR